MRQAQHRLVAGSCEGVKRRRLHLDRQNTQRTAAFDRPFGFPEWRVCGPGRSLVDRQIERAEPAHRRLDQRRVSLGKIGRRQIVIAGPLVAERPVDHDEIGWRPLRKDLAS